VPPAHAVADVFRPAARGTDGRSVAVTRRRPPALRQQRRRMSPTTATVPARPPAGTAARRPAALVPPRLRIVQRRRQTAATIAGRRPFAPPPNAHSATASHVARALVGTAPATSSHDVAAHHCTPVRAALSALQRARRRSPPAVTSSTVVVGNTAERCRPRRSHVGRAAVRRHQRLRYASPSVRAPPPWLHHCSPSPPYRRHVNYVIAHRRTSRTATQAPRQRRHRKSSHAPPRWRRENSAPPRRRHNFYNRYTPFLSARQPSEIANTPTHIFN